MGMLRPASKLTFRKGKSQQGTVKEFISKASIIHKKGKINSKLRDTKEEK